MWTIINIILIIVLFALAYVGLRKLIGPSNPVTNPTSDHSTTSSIGQSYMKQKPTIIHSEYFPDNLYTGKAVKLDSTITHLYPKSMFEFPLDVLIVKSFRTFDIDGNKFEEVEFDGIHVDGKRQDYMLMFDEYEDRLYLLNRLMTNGIQDGEEPPIVSQDTIELDEDGINYHFEDLSGLIKVHVSERGSYGGHDRLIRVYERELENEDSEYLFGVIDKHDTIQYYIGFVIQISQLENL